MTKMRNIVLCMITVLWNPSLAQALPMLGEETAWMYNLTYYYNQEDTHGTLEAEVWFELMDGDSIIDGTAYRKLSIATMYIGSNSQQWDDEDGRSHANLASAYDYADKSCVVLLREEDGKVYIQRQSYVDCLGSGGYEGSWMHDSIYVGPNDCPDQVLYDFTLREGDRYPMIGDVTVSSVEEVMTGDGVSRKLLTLSNGIQVLEGMGCVDCVGMLIGYQSTGKYYSPVGTSYYEGYSNAYYPYGTDSTSISFSWTPNSIKDNFKEETGKDSHQVIDLLGRLLSSPPEKGVYIQDGKKYVK